MDIENVTTTPLVKKEVKLYKIRWIIGFVLFINGFLVMFVWHFFGVINEILAKYFQVSEEIVDWLTMSAAVGTCGSGPIVGFIFVRKPTAVKAWYVVTIFVMIAAFSIFAIVIYIGKYLNLCILAQVVVGVVTAVFFLTIAFDFHSVVCGKRTSNCSRHRVVFNDGGSVSSFCSTATDVFSKWRNSGRNVSFSITSTKHGRF